MTMELFAGVAVVDYSVSLTWYEQLLGAPPSFIAGPTEAVWELEEHRYIYIEELPQRAGGALVTVFIGELEKRLAEIAERGIEPTHRETYGNGVRKATFRDPDGNEIGFGGEPLATEVLTPPSAV